MENGENVKRGSDEVLRTKGRETNENRSGSKTDETAKILPNENASDESPTNYAPDECVIIEHPPVKAKELLMSTKDPKEALKKTRTRRSSPSHQRPGSTPKNPLQRFLIPGKADEGKSEKNSVTIATPADNSAGEPNEAFVKPTASQEYTPNQRTGLPNNYDRESAGVVLPFPDPCLSLSDLTLEKPTGTGRSKNNKRKKSGGDGSSNERPGPRRRMSETGGGEDTGAGRMTDGGSWGERVEEHCIAEHSNPESGAENVLNTAEATGSTMNDGSYGARSGSGTPEE